MIAVIVLLNIWATKLKITYPILLLVAGLLISFIPRLPIVRIDPGLIFFIPFSIPKRRNLMIRFMVILVEDFHLVQQFLLNFQVRY